MTSGQWAISYHLAMPAPDDNPRLILLPGLGADFHLFMPQLKAFEHSIVPAWIEPTELREPLRLYSARFTEHLRREGQLEPPFALVGFSFGGQVAMEMARYLLMRRSSSEDQISLPHGLVLISACRSRESVSRRFVRQARLGSLAPRPLVRPIARIIAPRFARSNRLDQQQTRWLREMARSFDPAMLRWGAGATIDWTLTADDARAIEREIPILQIHGENDTVIPDTLREADVTIAGAHHLLQWTNAEHVNERIAEFISR